MAIIVPVLCSKLPRLSPPDYFLDEIHIKLDIHIWFYPPGAQTWQNEWLLDASWNSQCPKPKDLKKSHHISKLFFGNLSSQPLYHQFPENIVFSWIEDHQVPKITTNSKSSFTFYLACLTSCFVLPLFFKTIPKLDQLFTWSHQHQLTKIHPPPIRRINWLPLNLKNLFVEPKAKGCIPVITISELRTDSPVQSILCSIIWGDFMRRSRIYISI